MEAGLTGRVAGLAVTPVCEKPSDQVRFHGPVPVRAAWIVVESAAQMVAEPETAAIRLDITVTMAPPAPVPWQYASATDETV